MHKKYIKTMSLASTTSKKIIERIGIYGGTFDPFHNGHLAVSLTAYQQLHIDKILLVPVFSPAHKKSTLFCYEERVDMLQLATEEYPYLQVSTIESQLPTPSYTERTILALTDIIQSPVEFTLILGEDAFFTLPSWYQWPNLQTLCKIAVFPRTELEDLTSWNQKQTLLATIRAACLVTWLKTPQWPLASSSIKNMLQKGQTIDHMVPLEIARWIKANKQATLNRFI